MIKFLEKSLMVKKNSFKYIIGYDDYNYIGSLCIKLPQMTGYVRCFDNDKTMSFRVRDNNLFKKCTKIWERISSLMNIEFDSEPVYGDIDKYIKLK